jgi:hypothetical protein
MPTRTALTSRRSRSDDLIAIPPGLALTAQRQDGVVTRRQLRDAMVTLHRVENWIAARRWRAIGRNVVVLQNSPLTNRQREWAAVLLPEKPAALAGLSAAAAAGLQGFEPDKVHVVVAHDTHGGFPPWAKVHESRRFQPEDIAAGSAPPRTRTPRSIIDAATWSKWPRRACAILCAAVQQRLATADQLANELRVAGHVRHVAIMRNILGDIAGGGHTLAEINLGPLARRAGLLQPRRQRLRREPGGKVRWLDAEFDLPDGTVLVVEVDGAVHMQPESWWNDADRQNEVVIGRQPVLRFPSLMIRLNEARVVDQLRRMRVAHSA